MRRFSLIQFAIVAIIAASSCGSAVQAQIQHTWVGSQGTDTGNCDRTAPCATWSYAYGRTTVGGEITCLDSGNFWSLTIGHSITISCEGAIGSETVNTGAGFFNTFSIASTVATDVVTFRGLDVDGNGVVSTGGSGLITFQGAGTLRLEKMRISNISGDRTGLLFVPNGTAKLYIVDSIIANNGTSGINAGVLIRPASGVTANVTIERTVIENNRFGIFADGSAGGTLRGLVSDSYVSGNINNGITIASAGTSVALGIDNVKVANNNFGLVASGTNAGMLVRRSFITANGTGLLTLSGGVLLSYRDNSLNGNTTTDGAFTGPVGLQ